MATKLKNTTDQGEAAYASYTTAALLTEILTSAKPEGQFTVRHLGTVGYWYVKFNRSTGPTTTVYSRKIGPGETFTERNPPFGEVWLLADANVNGNLSWYDGWSSV